ncbi:sulfotransferase family protein [Formosa sp. PL04]|uniref:sulfotransferase family protein n=1 Tax=Formosa sp. PL04 TaxID=3081755 RepID=UPI0029819D5C|nr:sulfotransferase [Formosa sp. PL04]MDW5290286.1 sulfotransferase [Formosa sp. PL04]
MAINIIGVGLGRTGTNSLKLAINKLEQGPCHHMEGVFKNMDVQVPLWSEAIKGNANWSAIYEGYKSAVDWPTAGFFRELIKEYPTAKFILTERSPESWADSFGSTIYKLLQGPVPEHLQNWLKMANDVVVKSGFPIGSDRDQLIEGFIAHNKAVKESIPQEQLLIFQVKDGWEPLCEFLNVAVPNEAFPRTNNREEFWELIKGAS